MPEGFANKPELTPTEVFYWMAFRDLGTERQIGMGLGPIPWSCAKAYAGVHGIVGPDEFDDFWTIIGMVDSEYLKSQNEKVSAKTKRGKADKGKNPDGPLTRAMQNKKGKAKTT